MEKKAVKEDKVFLLGVGAQKCGTSWLASQLSNHSQFLMSPIKEIHYWDRRFYPDFFRKDSILEKVQKIANLKPQKLADSPLIERLLMNRHEAFYLSFFETRLQENHLAFGEFSPSYCILNSEQLKYIRNYMPYQTKVIFLMRDPVSRLWSQCKMEYMKARNRGNQLNPIEVFCNSAMLPKFFQRSNYQATIENIDIAFESQNRHYAFFEELFQPESMIKICDFIGINAFDADYSANPNEGIEIEQPDESDWRKIRVAYSPIYDYVESRFGRLPDKWKS